MRSMEQKRAKFAWECVKKQGENKDYKKYKEYRNLAKSAPAMIMSNGLMQLLAFLEGKKEVHHSLGEHIADWLQQQGIAPKANGGDKYRNLMDTLAAMESTEYQRATEEALAFLRWLRHLADSVVVSEKSKGENHGSE